MTIVRLTVHGVSGKCSLIVVGMVFLTLCLGVGRAEAGVPWWHINTISAPGSAGSNGRLVVEVSNLGDAPVDGFADPVSIVDELPAGVIPKQVYGEGGGSFPIGINGVKELMECHIVGQVVSCLYSGPLLSYERFMVAVAVEVEPGAGGGESEVVVSGGGAQRAVWRHALAMGEGVPSFAAETLELTPEQEGGVTETQAGSHPFQLTSTFTLNTRAVMTQQVGGLLPEVQPVALMKDLRFQLPPGLVGNPTPLPKCPLAVFVKPSTTSKCPDDTAIGVASAISTNPFTGKFVPFAQAMPVYSLEPAVGEPARFGFTTQVGPVVLDTSVSPDGGRYPVVVSAPDILYNLGFIGAQVTFWGVPALAAHDGARGSCLDQFEGSVHQITRWESTCPVQEKPQPFLIMPTACGEPLRTSVEGDSWEAIGHFSKLAEYTFVDGFGRPIAQDGCDGLSFEPSINVAPDGQQGSTPSGLSVDVHVDQEAGLDPGGLAETTVKDTTVALPAGVTLNPAGADGLLACTTAQVDLESGGEQSCPEASKVGTVEVRTPLLPNPLTGAAYLAAQEANPFGSLLALYVVVYDPVSGVRVKLAGEVKPDPLTGQLISTFKNTPQLPFEDFVVRFFGGSRAPLGTPARCGQYQTSASISPWSGNPSAELLSPPFQITSGPNGSSCAGAALPFAPSLTAGSLNLQAGGFTPFRMTMSREDGEQALNSVQLRTPPGLTGLLTGVALCPQAQANAGECGPQSLIGETTVSVGLGSTPYTVKGGRVYLTGPYEGAPFGLSIVNPAKAGPFDLEKTSAHHPACDCLVVRARIEVDPVTAALTVTSDSSGPYSIPTILEGIPLLIKHVNVTIDRPGFTFNPTNCAPMQITGALTSSEGATRVLSLPFQVTNCATLGFKPRFGVSTSGHTSRAKGASLRVKLAYPKAPFGSQVNIRSVKVSLPKQLPSRLTTLQKACPARVFEQNPAGCSADSRVGIARATTPLLPVELNGPAYFVSHGGAKFPELIIVLSGYGVTVDLHGETFINEKTNITSSTFRAVPDVPVGTFELSLPQGSNSALAATSNLCNTKLVMPTAFTAQNGMTIHRSTPISVSGCKKTKQKKAKHGKRPGRK